MRYYVKKYTKLKPGEEEYMSIDKIEDIFSGMNDILGFMIDELIESKFYIEAKGILMRNNLQNFV